jgi:TATA-box binding protein (TBP) (component of TFIID and TFIIIB)
MKYISMNIIWKFLNEILQIEQNIAKGTIKGNKELTIQTIVCSEEIWISHNMNAICWAFYV